MSLIKKVFVKLPVHQQDKLIEKLFKNGKIFKAPVFKMLLHSFEFFGGNLDEIRATFTSSENKKKPLMQICRELGGNLKISADKEERRGSKEEARKLYQRAAFYFLLGDWYTYDRKEIARNYELMLPCYDKMRELCVPLIEKIDIPFEIGSLKAYYRVPAEGNGPFAAVVIIQGNDEVKEFNCEFENMALKNRLATLNIDPPGWGESGITGNRFSSVETYAKAMKLAVDFLQSKNEICSDAIGVFGVSFGGTLAPVAAGLEQRFAAVAGMGGPILEINKLRRNIPKAQANRAFIYTGTNSLKELEAWTDKVDFKGIISKVNSPVLIVHGEKDDLVDPANAREIIRLVKGEKTLRIVPNGDHMCTHALANDVGPYIFKWLSEKLYSISKGC